MESLKNQAINGLIWSFLERFGFLILQFVTNIVLARLLTPSEFGIIGMMMVFIALSLTFIDGGFGSALIQKKTPDKNDYSTVFFINIGLAIVLYSLLFIFSHNIASFYNQPQLSQLLKVLGIILIIDSVGIVQNNILVKKINFKKIAKIKLTSALISCITAIILAYNGFGIWSLIVQYILNSTIRSLLLWISTNWRPSLLFSRVSFKQLFGFGSKILAARFISEVYINIQSLIIGRIFTSADLGFYTQAKLLQQIPVQSLSTVVNNVTYPIYSSLQEETDKLRNGVRTSLKSVVFINFPLMVLITVVAKPLFIFLYTEKWLQSVPYFQVLCIGFGMLLVVHSINLSVLKSVGRSDLILKLEIIKKAIGLLLIFFGIKMYGIMGILIALAINSYFEFFLNGYFTGKTIKYGISSQIKDIYPSLVVSLLVGFFAYHVMNLISSDSNFVLIFSTAVIYISLYLVLSVIFRIDAFNIYIRLLKGIVRKSI